MKFDSFMMDNGYKRTSLDHCMYIKKLKKEQSESFAMKDLELAQQILGMKISRAKNVKKL